MSGLTYNYILSRDVKPLGDYMADSDKPELRAKAIEEIIFSRGWANGYSENPKNGILLADWNYMSQKVQELLERAGYEIEWSENYELCDNCGLAIRTTHDNYCWQPEFIRTAEDGIYCNDCAAPYIPEYLESLENRYKMALNNYAINPADYGYTELQSGFENGWYGRNDEPKEILRSLQKEGKERVLFQVTGVGQFMVDFAVWEYTGELEAEYVTAYEDQDDE